MRIFSSLPSMAKSLVTISFVVTQAIEALRSTAGEIVSRIALSTARGTHRLTVSSVIRELACVSTWIRLALICTYLSRFGMAVPSWSPSFAPADVVAKADEEPITALPVDPAIVADKPAFLPSNVAIPRPWAPAEVGAARALDEALMLKSGLRSFTGGARLASSLLRRVISLNFKPRLLQRTSISNLMFILRSSTS